MPPPPPPGHLYLLKLIAKFPKHPALTLARIAYKKHPQLWKNLEAARDAVRYIIGSRGKKNRHNARHKHLFRKPRKPGARLPIPIVKKKKWGAFVITGPQRTLILSDIHIPFHDIGCLKLAIDYGKQRKPSLIILNGDIVDHFDLSRYMRDPRKRLFKKERKQLRQFLCYLREVFPQARIIYKFGNHEERYDAYMMAKAPEIYGIPEFRWEKIFGLKKYGVELVREDRPIRLGKLNILHGHEYRFNISNPVNPARGMFLRAKVHCIAGHFHQTSQHSEKNLEQDVTSTWSTGCLSYLHPDWRRINPWNHGFAFIETDEKGAFHVENLRIVDDRVW